MSRNMVTLLGIDRSAVNTWIETRSQIGQIYNSIPTMNYSIVSKINVPLWNNSLIANLKIYADPVLYPFNTDVVIKKPLWDYTSSIRAFSFSNNIQEIHSDYDGISYSDYYLSSFTTHKEKAKKLQKLIKGTLLQMIERIKASLFLQEIKNIRFKAYRLMAISRKTHLKIGFLGNWINDKELLFIPQSNEENKIVQEKIRHTKSVQTITDSQIFNTIVV